MALIMLLLVGSCILTACSSARMIEEANAMEFLAGEAFRENNFSLAMEYYQRAAHLQESIGGDNTSATIRFQSPIYDIDMEWLEDMEWLQNIDGMLFEGMYERDMQKINAWIDRTLEDSISVHHVWPDIVSNILQTSIMLGTDFPGASEFTIFSDTYTRLAQLSAYNGLSMQIFYNRVLSRVWGTLIDSAEFNAVVGTNPNGKILVCFSTEELDQIGINYAATSMLYAQFIPDSLAEVEFIIMVESRRERDGNTYTEHITNRDGTRTTNTVYGYRVNVIITLVCATDMSEIRRITTLRGRDSFLQRHNTTPNITTGTIAQGTPPPGEEVLAIIRGVLP